MSTFGVVLYIKSWEFTLFILSHFAAARMVGWCAHILELRQNNKVYSPASKYIGEINVPYVPIEQKIILK